MHGWGSESRLVKGRRVRHNPGMAREGHGDRVWTHRVRARWRQGCEAVGLELGPGCVSCSQQQLPGLGVARSQPPPLFTMLPRSLSPGSAVGRGFSQLAMSPGNQTSIQRAHRIHSTSQATRVILHLASTGFPYHSYTLEKDFTPYTKVHGADPPGNYTKGHGK